MMLKAHPVPSRGTGNGIARRRVMANDCRCRRSQGFTLLELLMALGLTVILLSAVYSALSLHWRSSTLGQVEAERTQIARAVLSRLASDIRSVVYAPPDAGTSTSTSTASADGTSTETSATDSTGTGTDSSGTDSATSTDTVLPGFEDVGDAYAAITTGVFGDGRTLVLHITRPERLKRSSGGSDVLSSGTERKTVAWFVADGQGTLQSTALALISVNSSAGSNTANQFGLVRMSGDRLSLDLSEGLLDQAAVLSRAEHLAPEIQTVSFEYHDGTEWVTDWDTEVAGGLPNAIGITIAFRSPNYPPGSIFTRRPSASTDTFRIVVPLLTAEPFKVAL